MLTTDSSVGSAACRAGSASRASSSSRSTSAFSKMKAGRSRICGNAGWPPPTRAGCGRQRPAAAGTRAPSGARRRARRRRQRTGAAPGVPARHAGTACRSSRRTPRRRGPAARRRPTAMPCNGSEALARVVEHLDVRAAGAGTGWPARTHDDDRVQTSPPEHAAGTAQQRGAVPLQGRLGRAHPGRTSPREHHAGRSHPAIVRRTASVFPGAPGSLVGSPAREPGRRP